MGWVWWVSLVVYISVKYHWNLLIKLLFQAVLLESWRSKKDWLLLKPSWPKIKLNLMVSKDQRNTYRRRQLCSPIVGLWLWWQQWNFYTSMLLHWSMLTRQMTSFVELDHTWMILALRATALSNSVTRKQFIMTFPASVLDHSGCSQWLQMRIYEDVQRQQRQRKMWTSQEYRGFLVQSWATWIIPFSVGEFVRGLKFFGYFIKMKLPKVKQGAVMSDIISWRWRGEHRPWAPLRIGRSSPVLIMSLPFVIYRIYIYI